MTTVLVLLGLGVLAARVPALPDRTPAALDWLVIWLALPGLILTRVVDLDLDASAVVPIGVAWGTLVLLALVVLGMGRARGWSRRTIGTLLLVVPLGNTSFLGFPAIEALLGAEHLPYAVIYDQLGTFLALATWGSFVAARYGAGSSPTAGATLRRILTFPPFVALLVALVLRQVALPVDVDRILFDVAGTYGDMLTPLTMLAIGMRLRLPTSWATIEPVGVGLILRLAVAPAAALGAAILFDGSGLAWDTSVLEAAMPPMVTAGIVATSAGLDEDIATALVGAGVLSAMVTLPLWAAVLTG